MNAIEFRDVSKSYPVYATPRDRLKELLTLNRMSFHEDFWALRDISFAVRKVRHSALSARTDRGKARYCKS